MLILASLEKKGDTGFPISPYARYGLTLDVLTISVRAKACAMLLSVGGIHLIN